MERFSTIRTFHGEEKFGNDGRSFVVGCSVLHAERTFPRICQGNCEHRSNCVIFTSGEGGLSAEVVFCQGTFQQMNLRFIEEFRRENLLWR